MRELQEFGFAKLELTTDQQLTMDEVNRLLSGRPPVPDCSRLPGSSICYGAVSAYEWQLRFKPLTVNQALHGEDAGQAIPPEPKASRSTPVQSSMSRKQRHQLLSKKLKRGRP